MYNIIPLVIILVSLSVIITIVVRKFQVLANLDIETIQSEREAKFKEQIISSRLKRNFFKYYSKIGKFIKPIILSIGNLFKWFFEKLVAYKESNTDKDKKESHDESDIDKLFSEADDFLKEENFREAEKKYIDIISKESKSIKAFRALGNLYYKEKNYPEAKQTIEHALKLLDKETDIKEKNGEAQSQIAGIYSDMAIISKDQENYQEALKSINQALKIEKNNPRYLDTKIEICIINKNKGTALDALENLEKVNPENNKLEDFKKQIKEL